MSGQRVTSKPHQTLNLLNVRQDQLLEELRTVEKQVKGVCHVGPSLSKAVFVH